MQFLLLGILIFFFCYFSWKWWGKNLANYLADETPDEKQRKSLIDKIDDLKKCAKELKESDDELKISKQLELLMEQLKDKEDELKEINEKLKK